MVNTKTTLSKKVLAIVLAVACMVAFTPAIAFTQSANAASKLKVSPTKATVYVAKTKTIKAKGLSKKHLKKVKWTTSKKSVVSISKTKGSYTKAKGKKAGTAYVTAKYGKKKAKAKITVKAYKSLSAVTVSNYSTGDNTAVMAGDILKATVDPSGATVKYQWMSNGTAISGATENTYKVDSAYVGTKITCEVTGTGSYAGTVTSTATPAVTATKLGSVSVKYPTTDQTTSKDAYLGDTLTVSAKTANGQVLKDVTYQWKYGFGTEIKGATSASYTITKDMIGQPIYCTVTPAKGVDGAAIDSVATNKVLNTVSVAAVKASVMQGATMATAITPTQAAKYVTYQWSYSATKTGAYGDITGATSSTYTADKAGYYKVTIKTVASSEFTVGTATATYTVAKTQLPSVTSKNITSAAELTPRTTNLENDILQIAVGTLTVDTDYTVVWKKVNSAGTVSSATNATTWANQNTYTIASGDVGESVYAEVSGKDDTVYSGSVVYSDKYAVSGTLAAPKLSTGSTVGTTLTATLSGVDSANYTLQWYRYNSTTKVSTAKFNTQQKYCLYDEPHKDYLYTTEWVKFICHLIDDCGFLKETIRNLKNKKCSIENYLKE